MCILLFIVLSHVFRKLSSAEDMEVKMLYGLTAVLTYVADNAIAVFESELLCNLRYSRSEEHTSELQSR